MSETYCYNADPNEGNYTVLNNTCIRDRRLSLKAKGLHTYFMSLPPNWKLYKSELVKHSRDGINSVNSAIKELVEFGYVEITEQQRTEEGKFSGKAYGFYAKPFVADVSSRRGFPVTAKPLTDKPLAENQPLLTTDIVTTKEIKTELTDYEPCSEIKQSVSETVFSCKIKELFGGDYPFDRNFEKGLCDKLVQCEVAESEYGTYLEYVFERTRQSNPRKSFAGLFRVLALSGSILNDFQQQVTYHSSQSDGVVQKRQRILLTVQCPVCGTEFVEYDYYCPTCYLSVTAIREHDDREIRLRTVLHNMSSEERQAFDAAREERLRGLNRSFFVGKEYEEFLRDYGIISTDVKENNYDN